MIKTSDLRIGNWVEYRRYINMPGEFKQVAGISPGKHYSRIFFNHFDDSDRGDSFHLEPIPLIPRILPKLGFKIFKAEWEDGSYAVKTCLTIYYEGDKVIRIHVGSSNILEHIKTVHQFQNLYFALTAEELQVNLTDLENP